MFWDLHGVTIKGNWNAAAVGERWLASFRSRPPGKAAADLSFSLNLVTAVPPSPPQPAQFQQSDLLEYYLSGQHVIAHLPRYGQLSLNLATGETFGEVTQAALETYGVFEDLIAIGLSPHLRRRGMFLIHAFAATPSPAPLARHRKFTDEGGSGVLIVGQIGSGKTTTGMALLNAGWKLLSNDSPIITTHGEILSYPGLLAAYPNTLQRFASTRSLISLNADTSQKIVVAAESIWSDVWAERAQPHAILFPQIESRDDHSLEPLSKPETLRLLLPHAIEQWDKEMMPAHLAALNQLVQTASAYRLRLGPETSILPDLIGSV
jgi:hypothetical protein